MNYKFLILGILCTVCLSFNANGQLPKIPIVPTQQELQRPFGKHDVTSFKSPSKVYHPETWFHYIGGNVSKEGITRDLEALATAGFSGIQLFHGQFGGE